MKVHLLRSAEYAEDKYSEALKLLQRTPGPIRFVGAEAVAEFGDEDLMFRPSRPDLGKKMTAPNGGATSPGRGAVASWRSLFEKCREYRRDADVGDAETVVLLTELDNENNWFSSGDPAGNRDSFVQTSQWERFMGSDQRFPVAYLVAAEILQRHLFPNFDDLLAHVHREPRGCVFDLCGEKEDIRVPMRCADLCDECMRLAGSDGVEGAVVAQTLAIMEDVRAQLLFKERFGFTLRPSRLSICGPGRKIVLDDLGALEVRLDPMQKTVYLFFLNHPEGVAINDLGDHEDELLEIYESVSSSRDHDANRERIAQLVNPAENTISVNISRIRRKFIEAVGERMTEDYVISGPRAGVRKIEIDRSLVTERPE